MPFPLLLSSEPYSTHQFTMFCPYCRDGDDTLFKCLPPQPHVTHIHSLEHWHYCNKHWCPIHYPYCYVLTLPLLFLIPLHLFTHPHMKLPIPGTALLSSLNSPILFLPTLLISSLALLPKLPLSLPCYALGYIPLTASLSSIPIILMGTP